MLQEATTKQDAAGREESAQEAGPLLKWQIYSRLYQGKRKAASLWLGHWVELGFCAADWDVEDDGDNQTTLHRIGEIEADFWCGDKMLAPSARINARHVVDKLLRGDPAAWNSFGASSHSTRRTLYSRSGSNKQPDCTIVTILNRTMVLGLDQCS